MTIFISEKFKKIIGFDYILNNLHIHSPYGKVYFNNLLPFTKQNDLENEYALIETFVEHLDTLSQLDEVLVHIKDITNTISKCEKGYILDIIDLYEIKIQAIFFEKIKAIINPLELNNFTLLDCQEIISLLSDKDNTSLDFYLYNSYSNSLANIRNKKRLLEKQISTAKMEEKETLLKARSELVVLEEEEELKIRTSLSTKLRPLMGILRLNIQKISHIDLLIAKAKLVVKYDLVKPRITNKTLSLIDMEHPLIKEKVVELGNQYTKNNIDLMPGSTVITGANMSGKSSVLKTVALNVYLAHLGFYVFARSAQIPILSGIIYLGIEDENSRHGLSAFGMEITLLNKVVKQMKVGNYLVCVDEFARSTNPYEGQKFVKALVEFANNHDSYTMIATHYDGVADSTITHYQVVGLKDIKTDINSININRLMDYSLKKVIGKSDVPKEAYRVSQILQIDEEFKTYLDESYKE